MLAVAALPEAENIRKANSGFLFWTKPILDMGFCMMQKMYSRESHKINSVCSHSVVHKHKALHHRVLVHMCGSGSLCNVPKRIAKCELVSIAGPANHLEMN